jgi:Peptidase_C39 like family
MRVVHNQFLEQTQHAGVQVCYQDINQSRLQALINDDCALLILRSTYRLDGNKAPHWVRLTSMDERYLYVHDPDLDTIQQRAIDCQYLPIARENFDKISSFGSGRLRTAVAIKPKKADAIRP